MEQEFLDSQCACSNIDTLIPERVILSTSLGRIPSQRSEGTARASPHKAMARDPYLESVSEWANMRIEERQRARQRTKKERAQQREEKKEREG